MCSLSISIGHFAMHDRGDPRRRPERMPLVHDRRALVVHAAGEQLNKLLAAELVNGVRELRVLGDDAFLPGGAATVKRALAQPVAGLLLGQ